MTKNTIEKEVEVSQMVEPKFLTLTGRPANQTAFKVVRDDGSVGHVAATMKRKRRSDPLLAITLGKITEDEAKATLDSYGLDGYKLETQDDGTLVAYRKDDWKTSSIAVRLAGDKVAYIAAPVKRTDEAIGIRLCSIEFAADYFDQDEVPAWFEKNGIDFSQYSIKNTEPESCRAVRNDVEVPEGTEIRRVRVDSGVDFVIVRSDSLDIPEGYIEAVSEAAYGSWGWGQLDFAAHMADVEFCSAASDASYVLSRVTEQILFYSYLSISARKELLARAASQYVEFIGTLMDALPERVVIANRSAEKENVMSKKEEQNGQAVERKDESQAQGDATKTAEATAAATETNITRDDVQKMIADATAATTAQLEEIKTALAGLKPAEKQEEQTDAKRSDGETNTDPAIEAMKEVVRSMGEIAASVKAVGERVEKLEGTTTVRSDEGDGKQTTARKDVFAGIFKSKSE